jgi:putative oxidoreductase
MSMIAAVVGRFFLAFLFIVSGLQKIVEPGPAAAMLEATNLPGSLAVPTGIFELAAGLLLAVGLMLRLVAIVLAVFVALTIFFFHHDFADPAGLTTALLHLAIVGGLLMVFAYGQVRGSYDYLRLRGKTHDAEVRAARAEGRAEVLENGATTIVADVDGDGVADVEPKRRWWRF